MVFESWLFRVLKAVLRSLRIDWFECVGGGIFRIGFLNLVDALIRIGVYGVNWSWNSDVIGIVIVIRVG